MNKIFKHSKLIAVATLIAISFSTSVLAKVVVVPLPAESVNKGLVPVAVGAIDSLGGISSGHGISSVSNPSTGEYIINIDGTISDANPIVVLSPFTIGFGIPEIMGYEKIDSDSFRVRVQDVAGTAKDSAFSFAVYYVE